MNDTIIMAHGSGGKATGELIQNIFANAFQNRILDQMEDAAVLSLSSLKDAIPVDEADSPNQFLPERLAVTTDSFVVSPVVFAGGDIGRLAVCGTVNDLLMRGAIPKYLTCGWILEEGTKIELLRHVVDSMAESAKEASVTIIAGDTKVIEGRQSSGIYLNTTGIGIIPDHVEISAEHARPGDVIIVSGTLGDHHAAILSERMEIKNQITSDVAPLTEMAKRLRSLSVHTMRDITRGGLATVLKELAQSSRVSFWIKDELLPVAPEVKDFCGLLGLDPLYMGNEGKLVCIVDPSDADAALAAIQDSRYGAHAAIIGHVGKESPGSVFAETRIGGLRELDVLQGEGLPRIC